MTKAFHSVRKGMDVDSILHGGAILPLLNFILPSQVGALCADFLRAFRSRHRAPENPVAVQAFHGISKEVVAAVQAMQDARGIFPTGAPQPPEWKGLPSPPATGIQCEDILAGDVDKVFLSLGRWIGRGRSGFVYDAEDLVGRGARVRPRDFLSPFIDHIERVLLSKAWRNPHDAQREIEEGLGRILERHELENDEALRFLRDRAWEDSEDPPEVVWPGPLPVDLALEVWKNGEMVPEEQRG